MAILEVTDIHKRFGGEEVLKGISFSLEQAMCWSSSARPAAAKPRCCAA